LFTPACVDLAPFAFCSETGDVLWEIEDGAFLGQDGRGVGCWPGHVEAADLLARCTCLTGEVAEGEELGCAGSGHFGLTFLIGWTGWFML
jgi:hypothetical protein